MTQSIHVSKANQSFDIDFAALPEASQAFVINYGLRQLLNDSVASVSTKNFPEASAEELVETAVDTVTGKIQALLDGTIGIRATTERDPLKVIMRQIANDMLSGALRAAGKKKKDIAKEALDSAIAKILADEKHLPTITAKAQAILAERNKALQSTIDLSDLDFGG